jgi:hypothetical protein
MIGSHDATTIYLDWQSQIDESMEAGAALLIEMGVTHRILPDLPALLALESLAARRTDFATPWLLVGGDGVTWMAALLSTTVEDEPTQSPAMTPLYGGADRATYMATMTTLPGVAHQTSYGGARDLPVPLHSLLIPASHPGVAPRWFSLPFVLLGQGESSASSEGVRSAPTGGEDLWVQWFSLLVVIGLVIFSLFI